MSWKSVAEDVALRIIHDNPDGQDVAGVNLLRAALIGMAFLPECPEQYSTAAKLLIDEYHQVEKGGAYIEWSWPARGAHLLLARLGGVEKYAADYYQSRS